MTAWAQHLVDNVGGLHSQTVVAKMENVNDQHCGQDFCFDIVLCIQCFTLCIHDIDGSHPHSHQTNHAPTNTHCDWHPPCLHPLEMVCQWSISKVDTLWFAHKSMGDFLSSDAAPTFCQSCCRFPSQPLDPTTLSS